MTKAKRACLVYTASTAGDRDAVRKRLEDGGYDVCEVEAQLADAVAAEAGEAAIPADLQACIDASEVCIFLIPDDASALGDVGSGIGVGNASGKRVVAVLAGQPKNLPQKVDDLADAVVCVDSDELIPAVEGKPVWEAPGKEDGQPRKTKRVKCQ